MTSPYSRQYLPPTTIFPTPDEKDLFIPFLNRQYEDIASVANSKVYSFFPIPISDTANDIPNLPNFGAFLVMVSGIDSTLPTLTTNLCKSDATAAGSVAVLGSQPGTQTWATFTLTITSTATNFQIAHNKTGFIGNFNIQIIGTQ